MISNLYDKDLDCQISSKALGKLTDTCKIQLTCCIGFMELHKYLEELTNRDILNIMEYDLKTTVDIKFHNDIGLWTAKVKNRNFAGFNLEDALLFAYMELY